MEEEDQPSTPTHFPQKPPPPTTSSSIAQKALFLFLFLFLIPFFPSEPPEFLNQTPLTRSWELVHLLLVGIAVSYGLCSRRNRDASDKDGPHKTPHQPNMALQVASVFDEDEDALLGFDLDRKTHMWNSRYQRGEPKVMLAGEARQGDKPLCLPVRSLRSQVPRSKSIQEDRMVGGYLDKETEKEGEGNDPVRPSPIPWRKIEPSSSVRDAPSSISRKSSSSSSSSSLSPFHSPDPRSKTTPKSSAAPPPPPPPPPRPFSASRRSLYPSERFQRKQSSKAVVLDDSNRSGGREHAPTTSKFPSQDEIFLLQPKPVPEVPQEETKKTIKKRNGSSRKFIIDSDDEEGSGSEAASESSSDASSSVTEAEAEGNEVDKKADEFIAKFREQIRLQRIESIKRSTAQRKRSA